MVMGLAAFVLLCTVVAAATGKTPENPGQEASCRTECAGPGVLYFSKGTRYSYRYSTSSGTSLQGSGTQKSSLGLEGLVILDVISRCHMVLWLQDIRVKSSLESKEEPMKESESLRMTLEKFPLSFVFRDGKIPKICPQQGDPSWVVNIKRGILSLLQTSPGTTIPETIDEVDVLGKCPTTYERKGPRLLKTKDLNQCSLRHHGFTFLRSEVLPGMPSPQPILASKLECYQSFQEGLLEDTACTEFDVVRPFSEKGNGVQTRTHSTLSLLHVRPQALSIKDYGKSYVSSLLYEWEGLAAQSQVADVAESVRKLCLAQATSFETAELFMELVFELRGLSADALMDLWQRSSFKCRDNWQPLVDALPSCGTEACVALMKELIISGDVENDEAESFLWSLAFVPQPTTGMIPLLLPLLQSPAVSSSAFLSVSALVHSLCMAGGTCEHLLGVSSLMNILKEALGENCGSQGSKDSGRLQLMLKAIGNAGLAAAPLAPILSSCAALKSNAPEIRLAAIQAFRRIPCSVNRSGLAQLYQATEEDAEIRMTAYYFFMKCPSEEAFALVRETQAAEKSTQVGAFVWSHLSQLLETDDPLKRSLRDSLPDDILSQEFEVETWKHSSYSDITFRSASSSMGANLEATLLFSPASFVPRSIMANLTTHIMGRAANILELGLRLENAEKLAYRLFGRQPVMAAFWDGDEKSESKPDTDTELEDEFNKKSGLVRAGCPSWGHSKLKELQEKVTQRWGKRRDLQCGLSLKIFGNELSFVDCGAVRSHMKRYSLNLAELTVKLLKGQEVQINRRLSLATEELSFPTVSGLPVQLALNTSAAINIRIRGTVDFKQFSDFSLEGYIKPSALIQIAAQMSVAGFHGKAGVKWVTGIRSSTSLDGGITVKRGQELKMFLNTPEESMELVNFSSKVYLTTVDGVMNIERLNSPSKMRSCTGEEASHIWGWQMCSEVSYPAQGQPFSLAVPIAAAVTLKKQDKGLQQYLLEAAYTYIPQKESWIPEEATIHFFMGTPKSERPRDVGVDFSFSLPQKKLRIKLLHPKKKIKVDGKIDSLQSTRFGHLEIILDDKDVYYIKGLSDVQTSRGEQRYETQLEAKLIRRGSPVILMGNITKQAGRKMTFSVSLMNVLKDKAFLSAILEKKVEDGLQLYALEGEVYLPDILGFHAIGLLQQRGSLWTNALRIKYGLLGEAKHLQQECNAGQKLKVENRLEVYKLDLGHEFHCTQVPTYNHKVQLQHEESMSRLHSMLEVSYGKHWDELNNKRKLRISQTFKNDSGPALSNYFMEFLLQVPERQVDYRTQLQHSSFSQGHVESSTHLKVQYNGRLPFVAGFQWKDMSRGLQWKWEGALNLDTPWLQLSLAHRLHQPHRAMYQTAWELTTGKALSIKNLVVELSCKDKIRDKEGKIHIYTPTTTYLRASTLITWDQSVLRSQGELVTTWSPLVQIKAHLENRRDKKLFHCWLKGPKQGLNLTSAYRHTEQPTKTTVLIMALWTDSKSQSTVLHLEGQLEELKRESLLYQKRGSLQLRHPLKLPIPQSLLLQETFTVDKSQKHYMLETKVLVNGLEECLQTLTLGYQADRPYICVTLTHPYNNKVIPKSVDTCVVTRIRQNGNQEVEADLKVDQKDILHLKGRRHNRSMEGDFRHGLSLDLTHSTQLKIPQALGLNGEIFFRQHPVGEFDCGVTLQAAASQKVISQFLLQLNGSRSHFGFFSQLRHPARETFPPNFQVQAAGRHYKDQSIYGSLSVHTSGKELGLLEASMSRETRKSSQGWDGSALLRQAIFPNPRAVRLQLSSKVTPARVRFFTKMMFNQNSAQLFFTGLKEEKVGPILSLHGRVQHNIDSWEAVPKLFDLTGSLKRKNHSNEGNLSILIDDALFGLRLRDKRVLGNSSTHSMTCVMIQNGSQAIPEELKLRGQLQTQPDGYHAHATFHADETVLSLGTTCIVTPGHRQLSANLTHNSSTLRNSGLPTDGEILFSHTYLAPNHRLTLGLQSNGGHIDAAFKVETPSGEFPEARITANLSHNVEDFRQLGIPFLVEGDCYYQNSDSRLVAGMKAGLDREYLRMALERKKSGGRSEEVVLGLQHSVPGLVGLVPSRLQVSCSGEASSSQLSGHCSGDVSHHPFESPAVMFLNGSLLARSCKASLIGRLSSGEAFSHVHFHAFCGFHNHLEVQLQHSWPLLKELGIARENLIRASVTGGDAPRVLLEVTTGPCSVMADAHVRTEGNMTETNWTLSLGNHCPILEKADFPQNLATRGSLKVGLCDGDLAIALQSDEGDAHMHLATSCRQKPLVQGSLHHSFRPLSRLGLPPSSVIHLESGLGSAPQSSLNLQVGQCRLQGRMELQPRNKTQWVLETETDCELLQDLGIPTRVHFNGSTQVAGCQVKLLCTLLMGGQEAFLELRGMCQPQLTIRATFRHTLPVLWSIPEETKLSFQAGKQAKYQLDLKLRSGACEIQANGDLQLEKKFQWRVLVENSCEATQALGAPGRIDGSGYVVVNSMDLDAQMLVSVDDSTLRGLLILKATETHQELDILFTHNLPDTLQFGIPARTLVDVTTVRSNHSYRRTIRFGMDTKQISEELSFTQQSDHISFDYKIRHNVPTLQALGLEDRIDLQVSLDHQAAKNLSGRVQYGSGIIIFGGQSQSTTARHSWSGTLCHNWPVLLQCGLPESLQGMMYLQGTSSNINSSVNILVGQTSLNYTMRCSYTRQQIAFSCWSRHNSSVLRQETGYPEVAGLTIMLQTHETQTQGSVDIQGGDRKVSLDVAALTALELNGTFELVAHIQHTVPIFKQLGLPFTTQLLFQEILAASEMKTSLEVTCESQTSLFIHVRGRNQLFSKELHVTSQQHLSFLLNHFPRRAKLSTKVSYSLSEAQSMIAVDLEKHHFHVATRLTFTASNLTQVTELMHTIPQLKMIPREMVLLTMYQKVNGTRTIQQLVLWDGQEFKFIGSYTGPFPKFSRSQHMQVELVHPLSIPFPQHSKITASLLHSVHNHQDNLVIKWNSKEQVVLSSSLKLGKDQVDGQVAFAHPFNLSWSHMEARGLAEKRGNRYSQQVQLTWNRGKPVNFQFTWADRSEAAITSWEGCLTACSGQLQKFLTLGNLKACGSVTQTAVVFSELLDLSWDSQKVKQSLKYERQRPLLSDRLHAEVTLENIFLTSCPKQTFLGEIETNYLNHLSHSLRLGLCDLSSAVVISGEHLLNQGSFMLQSRNLLRLAPDPGDGLVLVLTLRNHSTPKTQDFSGELELKAPGDQQVSLLGRVTESASQTIVLLQGSMEREEKLELTASWVSNCLRAYLAYGKGTKEEGVEISACSDGRQVAKAEAVLLVSGGQNEHLGQVVLRAANQSLSLAAHGCITPIANMESKLAEVGSHLQARLVEKFQVFDTYLQEFRDLVPQIDFLDSAAHWGLQMSQAAVRALQAGGRTAAGLWRQSSARQMLKHHLPLHLERLQTIMEQTQNELQKPLATLKDAYYEVTLKPLDEVWQERTEETMRRMQAFVPSGMKDTWLMRPILLSLQAVKGALDLAAHQILKWAEAKFSSAVRRIRKPLSSIYSFSARTCSVVVRLPVLPEGDQPMDLAKVTNYLIEEKLLQPLRELYSINLLAEYYRIKHRLLENPFEHHAVMIGDRHVVTFDGQTYDLTSKCSLLLAKDFVHNSFMFLLNQPNMGPRSLYVELNHTAFIIYPGPKVYKIYDSSLMGENCLGLDPLHAKVKANGRREVHKIELSNENGAMVSCNIHSDLCSMTLDGWNHGVSAGMLGTNDNEAGNDLLLPNGSLAGNLDEFTEAWQVDGECKAQRRKAEVCPGAASSRLCKVFFLDAHSELRNCFRVVDPAPFYSMCIQDACELSELQAACGMVSAYIHLCSRGFVPLATPPPCI
ncbi:uncharacterized protein [Notamacropus eugenii]|uniref:uncharacterized protein n=1 Tax=Notamacropus eugenii TaxID=9315 RepID=UPI003B67A8D4